MLDRFLSLTNVKTEDDKLLLTCYVISLFVPGIAKPVLVLHGEQGSAKTTMAEYVKALVDPAEPRTLTMQRNEAELAQQLQQHYVDSFDNLSHLPDWASDMLCRAVTGGGFSKRRLYTDDDTVIFNFKRAIILNGVNVAATRADLLDRSLIVQLERIPKEKRRRAGEVWAEFEALRPQLLAFIFETVAKAMSLVQSGTVKLQEYPCMADWTLWGEAISRALGHPAGAFAAAYYRNISLQTEAAIESSALAQAVVVFMSNRDVWTGTATELLEELEVVAQSSKRFKSAAQ